MNILANFSWFRRLIGGRWKIVGRGWVRVFDLTTRNVDEEHRTSQSYRGMRWRWWRLISAFLLPTFLAGCLSTGCHEAVWTHAKVIQTEEDQFNRQKYERRYQPAVQETEAYFSFTNRLGQRAKEPMELLDLGRVTVEYFGTNVAWQVVNAAWEDGTTGNLSLPLANDAGWMIQHKEQWMDGSPTDTMASQPLSELSQKIQKRDGTNFIGQYLGMAAELYVGAMWPSTNINKYVYMYSATSGGLLRIISYQEFRDVYVLKVKPEYPPIK